MNSNLSDFIRCTDLAPRISDIQRGEVCPYPIRVFIADRQSISIWGLRSLLKQYAPHIEVVGEACDVESLENQLGAIQATVLLIDSSLLKQEFSKNIKALLEIRPTPILVLSDASEERLQREAISQGAQGVLDKTALPIRLIRAIEALHNGETWINPILFSKPESCSVQSKLTREGPSMDERISSLTKSERETAQAMFRHGRDKNLVIASELNISPSTLRNRLTIIYEKLDVSGKAALILFVSENGLDAS